MERKKALGKMLFSSVISLLLCVSMLVGTTFAWFTDSVTSGNNIIASGNLDVVMYWSDGAKAVPADDSADWVDASTGAIFDYDKWEPGYTQVRHIKIANIGSLALKYKVSILANGTVSDLANVIDVYYMDPAVQVADRAELTDANKLGTLTEVLAKLGETGYGELLAGTADTITLAFKMQESAGNEYQDKSIGANFSVILNATQMTYEEDSFDDQYDADADNPTYSDPVFLPESGPMTIENSDSSFKTTLPAALVDELRDVLGDEDDEEYVPNLSLMLAGRKDDAETGIISFDVAEVIDENANTIDLEAMNNQIPVTVNVKVDDTFAVGDMVKIYHDGELVATTAVATDGYITYEALHFCEIQIVDADIFYVSSAEEFIKYLTLVKENADKNLSVDKTYRVKANFVLTDNIVVDEKTEFMFTSSSGAPFYVRGVAGKINLNGHSITVEPEALLSGKSYANAALLFQYSDVDIVGEGSIIVKNQSKAIYAWANCTVDIYGGTYISNSSDRNAAAVYVNSTSAKINVYGGTYTETKYAFNVHDNCGATPVIVLHEGITYADFLKSGTIDVIQSDIRAGRIVLADGCILSEYEENDNAMNKVVAE